MRNTHDDPVEEAIFHAQKAANLAIVDGVSSRFLRVRKSTRGETLLEGNSEGLVYLATLILKLAKGDAGNHIHLDDASILDSCEIPMVIAHCVADWEN